MLIKGKVNYPTYFFMVFYSSRSGLRTGAGLMKKEKCILLINCQFILALLISIKCKQCKCLKIDLNVQDHVSPRCRSLRSSLAFFGSKIQLKNKSEACLFNISKNNNRQSLYALRRLGKLLLTKEKVHKF